MNVLRFVVGLLTLAMGVLAVLPMPTYPLAALALFATENAQFAALGVALLVLPGWWISGLGRAAAFLLVAAASLALVPLQQAFSVANTVPDDLQAAFGRPIVALTDAAPRPQPLVAVDLFRGVDVPEARRSLRDLRQATLRHPLRLAMWLPPSIRVPPPCVVIVPSAMWRGGYPVEQAALNDYLAARGYVVVSIEYPTTVIRPFANALDDVVNGVAYLKRNAPHLSIDASRLVLVGRGTGAQLALLAAYRTVDPAVRGVVALYPSYTSHEDEQPGGIAGGTGVAGLFRGGPRPRQPARSEETSPLALVGRAAPPTLVIHGERDELNPVEDSEVLDARLAQYQRRHLLVRMPWATHACDASFRGPCGQISTYAIEWFLGTVMAPVTAVRR